MTIINKFLLLFLLFFMMLPLGCFKKGVLVIVTNHSEEIIRGLQLDYEGGMIGTDKIDHNQSFSNYVNPTSESNLSIRFIDKNGITRKDALDVYIEKNYSGRIEIIIERDYSVKVNQNIHIWNIS